MTKPPKLLRCPVCPLCQRDMQEIYSNSYRNAWFCQQLNEDGGHQVQLFGQRRTRSAAIKAAGRRVK